MGQEGVCEEHLKRVLVAGRSIPDRAGETDECCEVRPQQDAMELSVLEDLLSNKPPVDSPFPHECSRKVKSTSQVGPDVIRGGIAERQCQEDLNSDDGKGEDNKKAVSAHTLESNKQEGRKIEHEIHLDSNCQGHPKTGKQPHLVLQGEDTKGHGEGTKDVVEKSKNIDRMQSFRQTEKREQVRWSVGEQIDGECKELGAQVYSSVDVLGQANILTTRGHVVKSSEDSSVASGVDHGTSSTNNFTVVVLTPRIRAACSM